jgi:5-methylcytosine-specific restriction endonuclease McrA
VSYTRELRMPRKICDNPECEKEWSRQQALKSDKKKHAKNNKPCTCKTCGSVFSRVYGNKMRLYCCEDHQAIGKAKIANRSKGTFNNRAKKMLIRFYGNTNYRAHYKRIARATILKRDKYKCYICGQELNREYIEPYDPLNPTIDHIVPLAVGGDHKPSNVRACCMECNSMKGDSVENAVQLAMI